jgi:hypothetical protein
MDPAWSWLSSEEGEIATAGNRSCFAGHFSACSGDGFARRTSAAGITGYTIGVQDSWHVSYPPYDHVRTDQLDTRLRGNEDPRLALQPYAPHRLAGPASGTREASSLCELDQVTIQMFLVGFAGVRRRGVHIVLPALRRCSAEAPTQNDPFNKQSAPDVDTIASK